MSLLSEQDKYEIMKRRGFKSNKDDKKHRSSTLVIHHKDRNPENNDSSNLRVLTNEEHKELHRRYKR